MLLSHRAGLPALDTALSLSEVLSWDPVISAVEEQELQRQAPLPHAPHAVEQLEHAFAAPAILVDRLPEGPGEQRGPSCVPCISPSTIVAPGARRASTPPTLGPHTRAVTCAHDEPMATANMATSHRTNMSASWNVCVASVSTDGEAVSHGRCSPARDVT